MTVARANSPAQSPPDRSSSYWSRQQLQVSGTWTETDGRLAELQAQRPSIRSPTGATRRPTKFRPRRYQRSPDRQKSRYRRRGWARATDVYGPSDLFAPYTEGETAVLRVILSEVARHGYCDRDLNTIATKAGVCRTLVQRAIYWACELHDLTSTPRPVPGQKSKTNLIRVISPEWLAWIKRESRIRTGCTPVSQKTKVPPTKILFGDDRDGTAKKVTEEICTLAGIDPLACPRGWSDAPKKVNQWLKNGRSRGLILFGVRKAMLSEARKREGPPNAIQYFDRPIDQVIPQFGGRAVAAKAADEIWAHMFPGGVRRACG